MNKEKRDKAQAIIEDVVDDVATDAVHQLLEGCFFTNGHEDLYDAIVDEFDADDPEPKFPPVRRPYLERERSEEYREAMHEWENRRTARLEEVDELNPDTITFALLVATRATEILIGRIEAQHQLRR